MMLIQDNEWHDFLNVGESMCICKYILCPYDVQEYCIVEQSEHKCMHSSMVYVDLPSY
jgi:hypothetical protein